MARVIFPAFILFALTLAGTAQSGEPFVHRGCTKPQCYAGIPNADYQFQSRSRSEVAVSRIAVLVKKTTIEAAAEIAAAEKLAEEEEKKRQAAIRNGGQANGNGVQPNGNGPSPGPVAGPPDRLPPSIVRPPAVGASWSTEPDQLAALPCDPCLNPAQQPVPKPFEYLPEGVLREIQHRIVYPDPCWEPLLPKKRIIKLYQLSQPKLEIDHCSVSRVALQLHSDGSWVLSLRGDQNRRNEDGQPVSPSTVHIKRNLFTVKIRGYGNFTEAPTQAAVNAGKPELVDLQTIQFWVQNGEPRYLRTAGFDPRVRDFYELIDRVELEFYFR